MKYRIKRFLKKNFTKTITKETKYNEIGIPDGFEPINKTFRDDIFIAGYPKSGNTWLQNLIVGVQFGVETSLLPDKLTQELVPDVHGKSFYKRFGKFTFFKTHELPKKHMKRVIHLVRDGRDVMASYYAMNKAMGKTTTLEEMIISGKDIYPSKWHEHSKQWISNPYNADILVIKYEDLINDTFEQMKRVAEFANIERSEEIFKRSIYGNSFSEMKRKEKKFGWNNSDWNPEENFIRKGKIGSYKEEIREELIIYFEKESKIELTFFDYL